MITEARMVSRNGSREELRTVQSRAQSGDPDDFQAIFSRYSRPVLGFIYHMLGDQSRAEEATQETFVRAFARLPSWKGDARLSTWIFGIARNVVREAVKERYRRQPEVALEHRETRHLTDTSPPPDEEMIAVELQRTIREALGGLTVDQRLVFVLKVFRNMSYEEISQITGSSVGKLKTDLHRARLEMRRRLRPYLREGNSGPGGDP